MSPGRPVSGPFESLIGYAIDLEVPGGPTIALDVEAKHTNSFGVAHGGVALALLDTAGGVTLKTRYPDLLRVATVTLTTNFIQPVMPGLVLAQAKIDHIGGSLAYLSMRLHRGSLDGPILATATGAFRVFRTRG